MSAAEDKKKFLELLASTGRRGLDGVVAELDRLGFFTAPASTRFHLCEEGGLLQHSLNVCRAALKLRETFLSLDPSLAPRLPVDSIIIASLLHDSCKADIYRASFKWSKDSNNNWIKLPTYEANYDNFPLGHGEKSVIFLLRNGLEMTDDEILAIRWHMAAWDLPFQSYEMISNLNAARSKSPLLVLLQEADGLASHILERN